MAELLLTKEEQDSATFLEWSDETLGRAVKKIALILNDDNGKKALKYTGAAAFLIAVSMDCNSSETIIELEDVTLPKPVGNWKITLEQLNI